MAFPRITRRSIFTLLGGSSTLAPLIASANSAGGPKGDATDSHLPPGIPDQATIGAVLNPRTAAEIAVGVMPVNPWYPEGHLLRYGSNTIAGTTDMTAALNNATLVCARGKATLQLPPGQILITGTWNCTTKSAASNTTNGGLTVRGCGLVNSVIQYNAGANNMGIGWDMVGLAYGHFEAFSFVGGVSASNCPSVTLLQGAANVSGFIFSGINHFFDVGISGHGSYVVWNAGCEQQDFVDCTSIAYSSASDAAAWVFVGAGSAAGQVSAFSTINPTVSSMTVVHWQGAKSAMIFNSLRGILFHMPSPSVCADIRFDDFVQVKTASGAFRFMTDDSAGLAGCALFNCGSERFTLEVNTTNSNIQVGNFSAPVVTVKFEGHAASGRSGIAANPFEFAATCVPTNCWIDWGPNESATWSGSTIVACAGSENGIFVRAPVASANLISVARSRKIDGFAGFGLNGCGTDYAQQLGTHQVLGPANSSQFNLTRTVKAGPHVSSNSNWHEGVQTTPAVTSSTLTILNIPNFANIVSVTGADTRGNQFCDLLWVTSATCSVMQSAANSGSPAARNYSVASNALRLAMASGSYAVQASCVGFGMQV
jgi:hypothetical protein